MPKRPTKDVKEEAEKLLKDMLGALDEARLVTFDKQKGLVYIGGEVADDARLANLKAESEFMLSSELWKLLSETMRYMAYEQMFTKSTSFDDMRSGKMLLYHLDVQKKLMQAFKSYQKRVPPPLPGVR